ncbi:hypothetical protein ABZ635_05700 [Nocardiopsis sp. NPDC007018]|uniref:hypothetical protein n=1 Tax=Nocardiopsis sp. NPDC007018 TaxID=3155721 RepID=UPI0033CB9677
MTVRYSHEDNVLRIREFRATVGRIYRDAPAMVPVEGVAGLFSKTDSIYRSFASHPGLSSAEAEELEGFREEYEKMRMMVHHLVTPLPRFAGQKLKKPDEYSIVGVPQEEISAYQERSRDRTTQPISPSVYHGSLGRFVPHRGFLNGMGIEPDSVLREYGRRGGGDESPLSPARFGTLLAALLHARSDHQAEHPPEYLVDDRRNPKVRFPDGMLALRRLPESNYGVVTWQMPEELPGDVFLPPADGSGHRSALVGLVELGPDGEVLHPHRLLRQAERVVIEEAGRQGLPPQDLVKPGSGFRLVRDSQEQDVGRNSEAKAPVSAPAHGKTGLGGQLAKLASGGRSRNAVTGTPNAHDREPGS